MGIVYHIPNWPRCKIPGCPHSYHLAQNLDYCLQCLRAPVNVPAYEYKGGPIDWDPWKARV